MSDAKMLVDVYFLMDATGSMSSAIHGVKNEITGYVNGYCRRNAEVDLGYGLGIYRDESDSNIFNFIQKINTNVANFCSSLGDVRAMGGGDRLEGQVVPLSLIDRQSAGWRPGALRIIAWYGDHGAHSTRFYNGNTYTKETAVNNLLDNNTIVIGLSVGSNRLNSEGIAKFITSGTTGRYVEDVKNDKLCEALFNEISERYHLNK